MNTITIKLDNYNNLVITIVFAYLKAAMYADDPVPSFCQQDYGTSLLTCVAFCILLCTCNSLRFRPWLSVSLVMTRPKLTADAWVRTWVTLCEIHGA
jgi:phosphatidylserine synthase